MFHRMKDYLRSGIFGSANCINRYELMERSVPVLMGIFVFFNPFPHTTSIKEVCFYLSFGIVLLLVALKRTEFTLKMPLTLPFVLFAVWALVGLFFALDKENSIGDFRSHLLRYMVFYYLLVNYFDSKKRLLAFSWVIMISVALASVAGLCWYYFVLGNAFSGRFGLPFTEIPCNQIGLITVFATILCLHHFRTEESLMRKIGAILLAVPPLSAAFMTQARSSVIAICLSVAILFVRSRKILVGFILIFSIIVSVTPVGSRFLTNITNNIRIHNHLLTLEVIKDHPLVGIGFGLKRYDRILDLNVYAAKLPDKYRPKELLGIPHSILTNIAVRTGIIGLALFLWMIFIVLKMCWFSLRHRSDGFVKDWGLCVFSSFIGFFIIGLFEPVFFHAGEVVLYSIFAMATIVWRINKNCCQKKHGTAEAKKSE